ncbi:MAG: serine/threonine protein kinase, partial [Alphaproteobacteria bacterium]|nr:serine/threonine protein kinase [Alphaproteobacteria bacterium]
MSVDNVQALAPGTRLGDYRLDETIGHGGFGITYRAFDTQLAKFVAIKEYLPVEFAVRGSDGTVVPRGQRFAEDFAWGRDRFLDEARALARFRHPHIVPVLRYFEANDTAYTVMEFEDGKNVGELLRLPGGRLPPADVQRLADGLLGGLSAVHAQGFLHRDIKPSNIIIRRDGVPVLIDFGAARQAMGERTRTLTGVLTPQYAPIEQYSLESKQGPWSDIYSAAAVLYHAIIGKPPPDAAARVGVDPYLPLADTERDRFDAPFLVAIDRALAFAPERRPQTVEQWGRAFGLTVGRVDTAPTQRLETRPDDAPPRLGGASRGPEKASVEPVARPSRLAFWLVL